MENNNELDNNSADIIVSNAKSFLGLLPGIGAALSEIISIAIPNQRMDRIVKYLYKLNDEMKVLTDEIKNNKEKINLIETGLKSAANSTFEEKCEWIANIVIHGIKDDIEITFADNIINIISQLNYEQIIILYYYIKYRIVTEEGRLFTKKFDDIFNFSKYLDTDREKYNIMRSKDKYNKTILVNLGLLRNDIEIKKLPSINIIARDGGNSMEKFQKQLYELNKNLYDYTNSERFAATALGKEVIKIMKINI